MNGIKKTCEGGQDYYLADPNGELIIASDNELVVLGFPTDENIHGTNSLNLVASRLGITLPVEPCGITHTEIEMNRTGQDEGMYDCGLCGLHLNCRRGKVINNLPND